ncbi:phosphatase 2C-like domain-containing protein [Mrakia frigida]|uniref:PP2C family serine/threonine-protein phosphatase n=1 Tax=Mrakia frigida TaxID=29902 RepID=UPI003FCBEE39
MGQTLSEPVVEKHTGQGASDRFAYAYSEMQGWRISMEDAHATILSLPPATEDSSDSPPKVHPAFFAVYDGHGGSTVAKFTGATLHTRLSKLPAYAAGDYETAMRRAFLSTDEDLRANPEFANDPSGCTAVSVLITDDNRLICANAGDSRSIISVAGKELPLSHDHKPVNKEENARITAAGGFVEFGRVNGNLALSRAVGDFEFKQNYSLDAEHQVVTVDPDIIVHQCTGEEEFLIVACDGIWDCLTSQQVVDFTRRAIANGDALTKIAEDMMEKCLAPDSELGGVGCDNMTVVVVALLNGKTPEEWAAWVKKRVDEEVGYSTPQSVPDVFKTAPQYNRPAGGLTSAAASSATSVAGGIQGIVESASGRMMASGMSLQEMLRGSGISLVPGGGGMEDESEEDTEEDTDIEGDKIQEISSIPSDETKSGSISLADSPSTTSPNGDASPSSSSPKPKAVVSTPTPPKVASVGSPLVPSHPELTSKKAE